MAQHYGCQESSAIPPWIPPQLIRSPTQLACDQLCNTFSPHQYAPRQIAQCILTTTCVQVHMPSSATMPAVNLYNLFMMVRSRSFSDRINTTLWMCMAVVKSSPLTGSSLHITTLHPTQWTLNPLLPRPPPLHSLLRHRHPV